MCESTAAGSAGTKKASPQEEKISETLTKRVTTEGDTVNYQECICPPGYTAAQYTKEPIETTRDVTEVATKATETSEIPTVTTIDSVETTTGATKSSVHATENLTDQTKEVPSTSTKVTGTTEPSEPSTEDVLTTTVAAQSTFSFTDSKTGNVFEKLSYFGRLKLLNCSARIIK